MKTGIKKRSDAEVIADAVMEAAYVLVDKYDTDVQSSSEKIAAAIKYAAHAIGKEGASGMGAIEGLGVCVRDAGEAIAASNNAIADAIINLADAVGALRLAEESR